jgi:hypothetical protein
MQTGLSKPQNINRGRLNDVIKQHINIIHQEEEMILIRDTYEEIYLLSGLEVEYKCMIE